MNALINRQSPIETAWNSWRDFAAANRPGWMTRTIGAFFGSQACRNYEHYERGFRERFIEVACRSGHEDKAAFRALVDRQVKVFNVPKARELELLTSRLAIRPMLQGSGEELKAERFAPVHKFAGLQPGLQQAAETAGRMDGFAVQPRKDVPLEKQVTQWREQFAQACAGAAWEDREVRALMDLQPAEKQLDLREEITALARTAGPRAGAPLDRDAEGLAIQIVAGEISIHPAIGTISPRSNIAGVEGESAPARKRAGGASGLGALGGSEASPWPNPGAPDGRRIEGARHRRFSVSANQ